jgi:hypothetical protein
MIGILSKLQGLPSPRFAAVRFDYASRQMVERHLSGLRNWCRSRRTRECSIVEWRRALDGRRM